MTKPLTRISHLLDIGVRLAPAKDDSSRRLGIVFRADVFFAGVFVGASWGSETLEERGEFRGAADAVLEEVDYCQGRGW